MCEASNEERKEKEKRVWPVIAERDVFSPLVFMDESGVMEYYVWAL